jgi:hypothetical protein
VKLYQVEVVRYIRQYATVYVSANDNDNLDTVVDPQLSEAIKDKADEVGFETDWEYVPDYDIASIQDAEEMSGTTVDDVTDAELLRLEETDND